jgi:hypothetical protein
LSHSIYAFNHNTFTIVALKTLNLRNQLKKEHSQLCTVENGISQQAFKIGKEKMKQQNDWIDFRNIPPPRGSNSLSPGRGSSTPKVTKSSLAPKLTAPNPDGYKVVCYYTNWSQYR